MHLNLNVDIRVIPSSAYLREQGILVLFIGNHHHGRHSNLRAVHLDIPTHARERGSEREREEERENKLCAIIIIQYVMAHT